MLKGHVFEDQIFGNQIFALFINTFLNGQNGISNNYKNGMQVTYSGDTLTIQSGAVCIQGRFLEEDSNKEISAGTDNSYCKLVIEIDLDKQNTTDNFTQATYKIIKNSTTYPSLTQTNIVKNNSGVYQYELARFRTSSSGITNFQDMRTFLDFDSIYQKIQEEIDNIKNGSAFVPKSNFAVVTGTINITNGNGVQYVKYPTGFNENNCVVISVGVTVDDTGYYSFNADNVFRLIFSARLMNGFVRVDSTPLLNQGISGNQNFIVVLMKK